MRTYLILIKPHGQTSNNLFQHIHFESYCHSRGWAYVSPEYSDFVLGARISKFNFYLFKLLRFKLLIKFLVKICLAEEYNFDRKDFAEKKTKLQNSLKKIIYVKGWYFRVNELTKLYQSQFAQNFYEYSKLGGNTISNRLNKSKVILAVHIRRGDYKEFMGGKYFYEDETYLKYIRQIINLLGKPVEVILFTNDNNINMNNFQIDNCNVFISKGTVWEDYSLMSKSDYIIGPPSTFSMWASYIGAKPLYLIEDLTDNIVTLNQFRVILG